MHGSPSLGATVFVAAADAPSAKEMSELEVPTESVKSAAATKRLPVKILVMGES
jgi:hypothetical protein